MGADLKCNNLSDVLLTMLDMQDFINLSDANAAEGPQMGDVAPNGRAVAYGKRTKRKKHYTPDTMPTQRTIFDDFDRDIGTEKLNDWEGLHHDTR